MNMTDKSNIDTRAAGLAAAAALLPTIMTDTFKRDDVSEEFLNGMAYGVASYCSAIKALAAAPVQAAQSTAGAASIASDQAPAPDQRQPQVEWSSVSPAPLTITVAEASALPRHVFSQDEWADHLRQHAAVTAQPAPANSELRAQDPAADVAQTKELWQAALADAAMYVEAHCVDGERHARHIMEQPLPKIRATSAVPAQADADLLSALLWLYRRLPRGYGRQDHIERPILGLAAATGTDVAGDLAERSAPAIAKPMRAIDTFAGQPFAIVPGYRVEDDQPALACFTGSVYEFSDGDGYERVGDTLAGFPAEFLTQFQLEQRLWAAGAARQDAGGAGAADMCRCSEMAQVLQVPLTEVIVEAAHAAHATGRIALTFTDQAGVDRPTAIAKMFVRQLESIRGALRDAVEQDLPTGVSVSELAKLLNDLDKSTRWGSAGVADVCRRACDVIQRLLGGLSADQLAAVGAGSTEVVGEAG